MNTVAVLFIFAIGSSQGQMPQRINDPRMEYQVGFQPFGSNRPCSSLVNETLTSNADDVIIERILMNIDEPGNSFSSNGNRIENMAARICGQMQNSVGYLRNACQQQGSNADQTSQAKLRALGSLREYLCLNNANNLKEMIAANGGQCVRRVRDSPESNCNLPQFAGSSFSNSGASSSGSFNSGSSGNFGGSSSSFGGFNSGKSPARTLTFAILMAPNYNSDICRSISDASNCITDKYSRSVDICFPQFALHMNRIISSMLQSTCGITPNNNFFGNGDNNNFGSGNSNFGFNMNSGNNQNSFGSNNNNFPPNNNFPSGSNNVPQLDNNPRPTTFNPAVSPVWMTSTRRPLGRNSATTLQSISAMLLSVALMSCLVF